MNAANVVPVVESLGSGSGISRSPRLARRASKGVDAVGAGPPSGPRHPGRGLLPLGWASLWLGCLTTATHPDLAEAIRLLRAGQATRAAEVCRQLGAQRPTMSEIAPPKRTT